MALLTAEALRPRRNWQAIITLVILLVVGFLVILPMVFLVGESLNIGDPMSFPPEAYGIKNYLAILEEDINVLWNTVIIAVMATVMAILIGFTLAWILTPFFTSQLRQRTEQFGNLTAYVDRMMLQYYPDFAWAPLQQAA